jgi:hypothetical protein
MSEARYERLDAQWIKTLAKASAQEGVPAPIDAHEIQGRVQENLEGIIPCLLDLMVDACLIFNQYWPPGRALKVVPWHPEDPKIRPGFIVFSGARQLRIQGLPEHRIEETLVVFRDYQPQPQRLHTFEPHTDAFGGVTWIMDRLVTMTPELMVKQMLRDMCFASRLPNETQVMHSPGQALGRPTLFP